jgi:PAS domain S-box-containing protein
VRIVSLPAAVREALLEESLAELYEHSPSGYLTTLPDGTIVKLNETLAGWLGLSKAELIGTRLQDRLTLPGRVYFETHVAPLLRMQGEASEIALDLRCRDERVLPALVNCVARVSVSGVAQGYRITVFNATERRRYERELLLARRRAEDASRMKSDLLGMLGHDIRTPLSSIMNVARLLERTGSSEQQRGLIEILNRSSEGLLDLINDILDYSRLEAGKLPIEERPFAVRAMVQNLLAGFCAKAAERNLELAHRVDDALPWLLYGDSVKISQVLMNLVGNALKFTNFGGVKVEVRLLEADASHATVEFVVSDSGIGIEHEQLRNIFEEFTQANAEIGLKYGGTGLGLAISRKLLALFGSEMRVESKPGAGSSFSFQMKLRIAGDVPPAELPDR